VASCRTSASMPSISRSTSWAMCPSPRNSRSRVWACHSVSTGPSGHGRSACPANSGPSLRAPRRRAVRPDGPGRRAVRRSSDPAASPSMRRRASPPPGVRARARPQASRVPRRRPWTRGRGTAGSEEGGDDRAGVDGAHGGRPEAKYPDWPSRPSVRRSRLPPGRSTPSRGGLEGPPRLAGGEWADGGRPVAHGQRYPDGQVGAVPYSAGGRAPRRRRAGARNDGGTRDTQTQDTGVDDVERCLGMVGETAVVTKELAGPHQPGSVLARRRGVVRPVDVPGDAHRPRHRGRRSRRSSGACWSAIRLTRPDQA